MATIPSSFQRSNTQSSITQSPISSSRPTPSTNVTSTSRSFVSPSSPEQSRRQHFVLPDPVALIYLEQDPTTRVVERRHPLQGYQIYIVEQWICSRIHPTFVVTAYTGDPSHVITVGILGVPADENKWSDRVKVYLHAVSEYHARRKETPLGILMTTNLSAFPSSLTIIPVPDGDIKKYRENFFVNENLKRLGCSGRAGMTLSEPTMATKAKFQQLYKVSDKAPLNDAVIELVKLSQVALVLFGFLEPEYADGLLCDFTEKALSNWWTEIGTDLYNIEPSDGKLGPTTVAALLGALMGARNRLHVYGAPVSKDAFDVENTKRAIAYFQKAQKMTRTRRLDRHTFHRLHRATAKQASGSDGWAATRAVKSTMAELSGKGGEMVMEMVGNREKARISEVETADIENFAHLVRGERAQWLWQGKPRKRTTRDMFSEATLAQNPAKATEDYYTPTSAAPRTSLSQDQNRNRAISSATDSFLTPDSAEPDAFAKKTVLNRLKGTVGMKTNATSKEKETNGIYSNTETRSLESIESANSASPSSLGKADNAYTATANNSTARSEPDSGPLAPSTNGTTKPQENSPANRQPQLAPPIDLDSEDISPLGSVAGDRNNERTAIDDDDDDDATENEEEPKQDADSTREPTDISLLLRRTHSLSHVQTLHNPRNDAWWPRHLSFSAACDAVLLPSTADLSPGELHNKANSYFPEPAADLAHEHLLADTAKRLRAQIAHMALTLGAAAESKLRTVEELDTLAAQDNSQLNATYGPRAVEFSEQQEKSLEVVGEERARLQEMVREVETLGQKLEYEVGGLRSKVEEVEEAVKEFEGMVEYTEGRVRELVGKGAKMRAERRAGWGEWVWRVVFGGEAKKEVIKAYEVAKEDGLIPDGGDVATDTPLGSINVDDAMDDINKDLELHKSASESVK